MSDVFRELLKKVGSGVHTGKDLSREEAAMATRMMLLEEATPAQIGAFMIAHRIKRPTSEEVAGMLDAYDQLGPKLQPWGVENGQDSSTKSTFSQPVTVFGTPYDGRSRTAPVTSLTALILATAGVPVLMHGGDCMPTKYGVPLIEIWQGLGVDFSKLTLTQVQQLLETIGLGFIYLPQHFPQAHGLVAYRDQIGKRPPAATMELIWSPYAGDAHIVAGYVHPPTEERFRVTFELRGVTNFTLVKGLEGSFDLPRDRTAIIAISQPGTSTDFDRLLLHPRDYGFAGAEVPLESTTELLTQMQDVLKGKSSQLMPAAIWNGGFYLWRCGVCSDLPEGFAKAEALFTNGHVAQKLVELRKAIASLQLAHQR
ncbi:MAG TPA: anthranilate phosphoribosyltransferase family protein [Coleofasciculaceae cyanobacterium]